MKSRPLDQALDALEWSHATFPYILLTHYHTLGLSDHDAMVILHIIACQQVEHSFPSVDELSDRMSLSRQEIAIILQRLFGDGLMLHEGQRVSIRPLMERVLGIQNQEQAALSVFTRFEEEFGRLLSPLEYEQIVRWLEEDEYPEWMIVEALRESVLAGVYNFRYVDTILRDWGRSNIQSESQLSDYLKRHRQRLDDKSKERRSTRKPETASAKMLVPPDNDERVVPAAQPGKYERFYQLYRQASAVSGQQEKTTRGV